MGIKRGHRYGEHTKVPCPVCGLMFQKSGLAGHLEWKHKTTIDGQPEVAEDTVTNEPVQVPANAPSDLKALGEDVAKLRLLKQKRDLTGLGESAPPTKSATVRGMEDELEIMQLEGRLRQTQSRLSDPAQPPRSDLQKMADEAEALDRIRGHNPPQGNGLLSQALSLATTLGFSKDDIRGAVGRVINPQRVSTNGMDLGGFKLPADVSDATFQKVLDYRREVDVASVEKARGDRMAESWDRMQATLMPMIIERFGQGGGPGGPGIAKEPKMHLVHCECGQAFQIAVEDLGKKTECPKCGEEVEVTELPPSSTRPNRVKPPKPAPAPEPDLMSCLACSGQVDITGLPIGTELECPHCSKTIVVAESLDTPLKPRPVSKEDSSLGERDRRQ